MYGWTITQSILLRGEVLIRTDRAHSILVLLLWTRAPLPPCHTATTTSLSRVLSSALIPFKWRLHGYSRDGRLPHVPTFLLHLPHLCDPGPPPLGIPSDWPERSTVSAHPQLLLLKGMRTIQKCTRERGLCCSLLLRRPRRGMRMIGRLRRLWRVFVLLLV
jgi:hypothetical protein